MNVRVYLRQVFVLLFGNAAAQLINLASYPVLTRLYGPAEFGSFALFLTAVGIIGPVSAARFDIIVQSSRDWQLAAVFRHALRMNCLVALASGALAFAYGELSGAFGWDIALAIAVGVLLTGYTLTAGALLFRQERFRLSAQSLMLRSLVTAAFQIGLWFVLPGALALIIGFCLGFAAQALTMFRGLRSTSWKRSLPRHRRAVQARFRRQVSVDIPSMLLGAVVLNVMNLLLLDLYSREQVGFYSLAFRVAVLPLSLISGSLSDVFFQKASASYRRCGAFWSELRFNITTASFLSLVIFVPMALLAPPLFRIVFGQRWLTAADMLVLLVPMLAVRFVSATIQTAPLVVGKANWLLAQNIGLVTVMLIVYGAAKVVQLPIHSYLLMTSLLMALVYGCNVAFIAWTVNRSYRQRPVPARSIGAAR